MTLEVHALLRDTDSDILCAEASAFFVILREGQVKKKTIFGVPALYLTTTEYWVNLREQHEETPKQHV